MSAGEVVGGYILPGQPHPLLVPEANPGYAALRDAYAEVGRRIVSSGADLVLLYSTKWPCVIGHQIQAHPNPVWTHVDQEWHELGEIHYDLTIDADYAEAYQRAATARGLHARTVAYHGFPLDTGTVTALKLMGVDGWDDRLRSCVVSCNMYADRAETLVLGKAARDAAEATGRRVVAVAVTALSNRYHTEPVAFAEDHISSAKDDDWNQKLLQFLAQGRLEDVSQLAREFSKQANGDSRLKALWWLAALMGQTNDYRGEVLEYRPVYGTGAAVVELIPGASGGTDKEFDEQDVETFAGDRGVLSRMSGPAPREAAAGTTSRPDTEAPGGTRRTPQTEAIRVSASEGAPAPVGSYPHARRVGDHLYLSGVGPRQAGTNAIPGGPIRDADGARLEYDMAAQTRAALENVRAVLEAAGSSLDRVVDVTSFLIDMDRDFQAYNGVYAEYFGDIQPARTTLAIQALPTPIAIEFKVLALTGAPVNADTEDIQ